MKRAIPDFFNPDAKKPKAPSGPRPIFVSATGAGGGRSRHALLSRFGDIVEFEFNGQPNLTSAAAERVFVEQLLDACNKASVTGRPLFIAGHSFGSRVAAHLLASADFRARLPPSYAGLLAFGYPLAHASQHREKKLAELRNDERVLFLSGTKDTFADFPLFRAATAGKSNMTIVELEGGDHSLKCAKKYENDVVARISESVAAFVGGGNESVKS